MKTIVAAAIGLLYLAAEPSAQCSMCRSVLESPEAAGLAAALRSGILVLIAAPFASFVAVAALAIRSQRAASGLERQAEREVNGS